MTDGTSPWSTLILIALMLGAFYLMVVRPAARKTREQQTMVSSLQPGARIMTTAGVYATVRHLGTTQAVVEIAPGVDMTVARAAIMKTVNPAEEDFEYDDAPEEAAADDAAVDELPASGPPADEPGGRGMAG